MHRPLILELLVVLADEVATDASLEVCHNLGQSLVSHVLQSAEHSSLEEDLGVTETVVVLVELQSNEDLLGDNLAVDETRRDHVRSQDRVSIEKEYG